MKKINKYLNYAKKFVLSDGKNVIIKDIFQETKLLGFKDGAKSFLHKRYLKELYGNNWQQVVAIKDSGLFNSDFYLEKYSDVKATKMDPLVHFCDYGWKEGRNPSVSFDTNYYVSTYSIDINPLFHYLTIGQANGYLTLRPNNTFDFNSEKTPLQEYLIESNAVQDVIVLITHDMSRSGAPLLLLNIARELSEQHHKRIILISTVDGELRLDFECYCHVICLKQNHLNYLECYEQVEELFYTLFDYSVNNVLANTIGSCLFVPVLEKYGFDYQILIHELPDVIERMNWTELVKSNLPQIKNGKAVYSSKFVLESHQNNFDLPQKVDVIPQGMFHNVSYIINKDSQIRLRQRYNLPLDSKIIFNGGRDLPRKGVDLFYQIAQQVTLANKHIYFIYLCDKTAPELVELLGEDFDKNPNIIFDDFASDYSLYLEGSDVFALTSREDPFPNVMLDSLAHGLPMIAFDKCGGAPEVLNTINKVLVADYLDTNDFASKVIQLVTDNELYKTISHKSLEIIKDYKFDKYVNSLLIGYSLIDFKPYIVKSSQLSISNKILHIIGNFNVGGSSQLVVDLIEKLYEFKHFVVTQYVPHPQKYLGVEIWQIDNDLEELKYLINKIRPSIIHVHYWGRGDAHWYNNIYSVLEQYQIPVIQNINVPVNPLISKVNTSYVYVSNYVKQIFKSDNQKLESVIYPGSDFSFFSARKLSELLDAEYVGMVYRLDVDKVNEKSILPFIELCKINSQVKCMIVGDGVLLPIYKQAVIDAGFEGRFLFTGYVPYAQLPSLYRKMRIFMAPVFDESFGQVTPFAMSIGMPVIAYDTGALSEIIANDSLLAKTGDAVGLATICNNLWNAAKRLDEISKFNQTRSINNFSIQSMIDSYRKLYVQSKFNTSLKYLFVALNPSAQEGGGADVLWVDTVNYLVTLGLEPSLVVHSRNNLSNKVNGLANSGAKISYFSEDGYSILEKNSYDIVVFIQGDHNEGGEWFKRCYTKKIPYTIVNQLTKEGFWVDDDQSELIRNGYKYAYKTFFTCENNRLLMERQIGLKLDNAERHCNPVAGVDRDVNLPFPEVFDDEYHLACPSRLITIHKGQDLLFEVLKQDKWKQRKLIINLYGNGPNKRQLEQLKTYYQVKNINFCGYSRDVKDIWRKNHGIIMPSHMEGVPIVLLGAMLCARVPVLTDVGGHRELVEDNVSGFLAKAPTAELIDEALERVWQNRHSWQKIGLKARDSVLKFQSENPVQDFIELVFS